MAETASVKGDGVEKHDGRSGALADLPGRGARLLHVRIGEHEVPDEVHEIVPRGDERP